MKKRLVQTIVVALSVIALLLCGISENISVVEVEEDPVALSSGTGTVVQPTDADTNIMPDKYNTGAKGDLIMVGLGDTVNGIKFVPGNNSTVNALDFPKKNAHISGTVTFENYDFSSYPLWTYSEYDIKVPIKVIFNNCKFSQIATGKTETLISYEFNNCTINSFKGSNATFNQCMFGKSYSDGIVPFINVSVNDCFFCDMASTSEEGAGLHTDGTQIYGYADLDVTNVSYNNCRFEIPAIETGGNTAYINACIMLQLEYSNAKNVSFSNCTVNGGGYSIYARDINKGFTFEDVTFDNIRVGCTKLYGSFFPYISSGIVMKNIGETQNLYVGSVWKENGKTHFSVTNDTDIERELVIYADGKQYYYRIPACPSGGVSLSSYEEYPFDIDIVLPVDCGYAVCYDNTISGAAKQIRFENWSGGQVYLNEATETLLEKVGGEILIAGECGKNVTYTVSGAGVLSLEGEGETYSYNSTKQAPWKEYRSFIREIRVGEGITVIGAQIFKDCSNVANVSLPAGLTIISPRAFMGCSSLTEIVLPDSIAEIGDNAFWGSIIQKAYYLGTSEQWSAVIVGKDNDLIVNNISIQVVPTFSGSAPSPLLQEGECGEKVHFMLSKDGTLILEGEGATYNYCSVRNAPWYDNRELIERVVVKEGITKLGDQLFRKCDQLVEVELPTTLKIIGCNSFIACKKLTEIVIPHNVSEIYRYAFNGTALRKTIYEGSQIEWGKIVIDLFNYPLENNVSFLDKKH